MPHFGRIPQNTADLFERTIRQVRDEVLTALPPGSTAQIQSYTLEAVLETVLRDWRVNDNTTGLLPDDVADLRSFVQLACSLAGSDPGRGGFPIYQASLKNLLDDWLDNWNADGNPGPPRR